MNSEEAIFHARRLLPDTDLVELIREVLGEAILIAAGFKAEQINKEAAKGVQRELERSVLADNGVDLGEVALRLVEYVHPLLDDFDLVEEAEASRRVQELIRTADDARDTDDPRISDAEFFSAEPR